jgi:hypothetical protein
LISSGTGIHYLDFKFLKENEIGGYQTLPVNVEIPRLAISSEEERRKKIPSKFHLLLNKRWNPRPPSMFNEPGTVLL